MGLQRKKEVIAMSWMKRRQRVEQSRRHVRNYEFERGVHQLRLFALYVILGFVLGMFIKNINPTAVLWEFLQDLFSFWGHRQ